MSQKCLKSAFSPFGTELKPPHKMHIISMILKKKKSIAGWVAQKLRALAVLTEVLTQVQFPASTHDDIKPSVIHYRGFGTFF